MSKMPRQKIYEAIARSLRQFGYPSVTAVEVADTHWAMEHTETPLPHGVVGLFAEDQLKKVDWSQVE